MDIGTGDFVEFVGWHPAHGIPAATRFDIGFVARVTRVFPCRGNHGDTPGLELASIPAPVGFHGWCACGFRPVYRPKEEVIRRLTAPAPGALLEPAL